MIDLADETASEAFRATRPAMHALSPIARFRISLSRTFELSPTINDMRRRGHFQDAAMQVEHINNSVLFAAADNWSLGAGYYVQRNVDRNEPGEIDWLALAADGLRLNTPSEVAAKLDARDPSSFPIDTTDEGDEA